MEMIHMKLKTSFGLALVALLGALAMTGCGEANRIYDCTKICDKYSECIDDDINKTECVDRCEDEGDADPDFEERADDCEKCLDDKSCTEATVECATTCAWVVAESA